MLKKVVKVLTTLLISLVIILSLAALLPQLVTRIYTLPRLYPINQVPAAPVAIVFGAGLRRDGSPSPVLRDRINTAVELYNTRKVQKLLMSGDNRFIEYNEPGAMREYAISQGIPPDDIVLDFAGRRTYDTCYRAKHIFNVESAILVTQGFHLPRAVYVCNRLGIPAVGVSADIRQYRPLSRLYWGMRETAATLVALWEVHVSRPLPVLGNPEPIFPKEAQ
jgi:SanA protein